MPIRASAGESQPARSVLVYLVDHYGERANRICYLCFNAEVGTGNAMCVRVGTGLLKLVAGFVCCFSRDNSVRQNSSWEAFRQTCRSFISSPMEAQGMQNMQPWHVGLRR